MLHNFAMDFKNLKMKNIFEEVAIPFAKRSPITTFQFAAGITLYGANLVRIFPSRLVLHHPFLSFNNFQLYRLPLSFLVVGTTAYDVIHRSIGLLMWQAPLEAAFNAPRRVLNDGETNNNQTRENSIVESSKSFIKSNRFLQAQLIASATIVAVDYLTYIPPSSASEGGLIKIFTYTLFPTLEYSMRWLWAATETKTSVPALGIIPMPPIYTPIVVCALGGFRQFDDLIKGLIGAVAVGYVLDLRRSDGKKVVEWLKDLAKWWGLLAYNTGLKLTGNEPSVAPNPSSSAGETEQSEPTYGPMPAELATAAVAFLMQTFNNGGGGPSINLGF